METKVEVKSNQSIREFSKLIWNKYNILNFIYLE